MIHSMDCIVRRYRSWQDIIGTHVVAAAAADDDDDDENDHDPLQTAFSA
jgi:hypothetical protein